MSDTSNEPTINAENIDHLVRDFGNPLEADRKAALLSTLQNEEALYVRKAMERGKYSGPQKTFSGRGQDD